MLAVAPRVICLDEPTAGVAQREAEAFGPLILRVQQELDATLVVVEHDLPLILSISSRVYCLEAGSGDRPGRCPARSATTRAWSRRTSAPTSARSSAATRRRRSRRRPPDTAPSDVTLLRRLGALPAAGVLDGGDRLPVAVRRPCSSRTLTSRNASSAAYLPLHSDAISVGTSSILPKLSTVFCQFLIVRFGSDLLRDGLEHEQLTAEVGDRDVELDASCPCCCVAASSGPGHRRAGGLLVDVDALLEQRCSCSPTAPVRSSPVVAEHALVRVRASRPPSPRPGACCAVASESAISRALGQSPP